MFITPQNLLAAATATGAGSPAQCAPELAWKPTGIQVFGTFTGTVILEGTIATKDEIDGATAVWTPVSGASWTAAGIASLTLPYTHIRANVTAYTNGSINVRAL
jgi:hypothetical protein